MKPNEKQALAVPPQVEQWRTCPTCFGRGYRPETRRPSKRNPHAVGFYARTCRRCDGRGAFLIPQVEQ